MLNKVNFGTPVWKVKLKVVVRAQRVDIDKVFKYADAIRTAQKIESFEWFYTREEFLACGDAEDPTLKTIEVELVVDENLEWLASYVEKLAWEYYGFIAKLRRDNLGLYHFLPFGKN